MVKVAEANGCCVSFVCAIVVGSSIWLQVGCFGEFPASGDYGPLSLVSVYGASKFGCTISVMQ